MREALTRFLVDKDRSEEAQDRERIDVLEQRMETLAAQASDVRAEMSKELKRLSESAQALRDEIEGRSQTAAPQMSRDASASSVEHSWETTYYHDQLDPSVISKEPRPNEETIYGKAFPLVVEWRELVARRRAGYKDKLEAARAGERILQIEVALMRDMGMTLPPETYPLRGSARTRQLGWRVDGLRDVRREREWRELRRAVRKVLTLGLWR